MAIWGPLRETLHSTHIHIHLGEHDLGRYVSLPSLLRFITGTSSIPPMGLKKPLQCQYHPNKEKCLPNSSACSNKITLPICHQRNNFLQHSRRLLNLVVVLALHKGFLLDFVNEHGTFH